MQRAAQKTTAFVATAAAIGFTSLFGVASPATAAPAACTQGVALPSSTICELKFTASGTFTPSVDMGQLEVLLVAGGGSGAVAANGYGAGGGGGGEVKVVGFGGDTSTPMNLVVGGAGQASTATQGATVASAAPGTNGTIGALGILPYGGASGNGNAGAADGSIGGGGGGAGASPVSSPLNGGAGVTAASAGGSLFNGDTSCYGGGGAAGDYYNSIGTASCGGGSVVLGAGNVDPVAAAPNSGGGGGGGGATNTPLRAGASGLIVLRWNPLETVTVSFDSNGHGGAVAPQTVAAGNTVTSPALSEPGFVFNGWFTDAALTTKVDFSTAVTASTTYFAKWTAVAPATVTVSFDGNGHGGVVAPQSFVSGGTVSKPSNPSAAGFVFDGWFTDAALTKPADFSAPVTASTTFYAKWSAAPAQTVTITFNIGGHGSGIAPQSFAVGGTVAQPADPTADGFIFNGWFTDAALTKRADFSAPITEATTFYASWSAVATPTPTPTPSPTPIPTTKPSVAPVPPKADAPLAKTGATLDPSAASLALAALGLGAGLLALRARRVRKAD